ncbi:hypothetical protein SDC9_167356 [bioreactor metagenome]|uniref:Uncharacterized protein n=1 Tax=bioreactor metagenome TaxID=1076179 RepID=A0A645FZK2_9ZZZZ
MIVRSILAVCLFAFASEISGISRMERADRKEEGKKRIGMAIPFKEPNSDRAFSRDEVNWLKQFGTSRFSTVRSKVVSQPAAAMGAAMAIRR